MSMEGYLLVLGVGDEEAGVSRAVLRRGQFHDVVLLDDVTYRFPRDEQSQQLLPRRVETMGVLATRLAVGVPSALSVDGITLPLGQCHVALRRLIGQPLGEGDISDSPGEEAVVHEVAKVLDTLAALGADGAVTQVVPRAGRDDWRRFVHEGETTLYPLMSRAGRVRAAAELDRVLAVDPTGDAVVHGDLGGDNLLWSRDGDGRPRLSGILDWDGVQIGSQADDLASLAVTFGWPVARRVDEHRHAGRTPTINDAQAIAGTFALQEALPAVLSGDDAAVARGLANYRAEP